MSNFFLFFFIQALLYGLLCWNYRAVAKGHYKHIAMSDLAIAALNFLVIKRVSESDSYVAMAGYILGGVTGSLVSVWLTERFAGATNAKTSQAA